MNLLFLTMTRFGDGTGHGIYTDLMRKFREQGHEVYVIYPVERGAASPCLSQPSPEGKGEASPPTPPLKGRGEVVKGGFLLEYDGMHILGVKTLKVQKTNVIEKGLGQVLIEPLFTRALKKYFARVKFDIITYSTPPITLVGAIKWAKRHNPQAMTYLQLKDIFPQNAVDLGMMPASPKSSLRKETLSFGLKAPKGKDLVKWPVTFTKYLLYKQFRNKEKELYRISDWIGCMSPANVKYVIDHNPEVDKSKVEICPNSLSLESESLLNPPLKGRTFERDSKLKSDLGIHTADPVWYGMLKDFAEENRKNPTEAEKVLWNALKSKGIGFKFRQQHIIEDFIVDFYCNEKKLTIELDGGYHNQPEQMKSDEERTARLKELGYTEIRFTNEQVLFDLDNILKEIERVCKSLPSGFCPPTTGEVKGVRLEEASLPSLQGRDGVRLQYGLPADKPIFFYGGNLGKPQGIPFLIECLESLSQPSPEGKGFPDRCHFLIVGDGVDYPLLKAWYDEAKPGNVTLLQHLPKEEYDQLAASCDVGLIFLDYRFTIPNYPSRLLSCLATRKPIIACTDPNCDTGTIAEANGYGYWCPSNSVEAFTAAVDRMLSLSPDPSPLERGGDYSGELRDKLREMGEAGYRFLLDNYTVEHTYNAIMQHLARDYDNMNQ